MGDLVPIQRKFRSQVPEAHKQSLDTRLHWMWHQRFGTVQQIWKDSRDVLDHTAATLILQAIMGKDLASISQLFQRIEGAPISDTEILDAEEPMRI